jgi:hypothetical protein
LVVDELTMNAIGSRENRARAHLRSIAKLLCIHRDNSELTNRVIAISVANIP